MKRLSPWLQLMLAEVARKQEEEAQRERSHSAPQPAGAPCAGSSVAVTERRATARD